MRKISVKEILHAVKGKLICGSFETTIDSVCIDSRKIAKGSLFIPIKGANFDGHTFIKGAMDLGAECSLTHEEIPPIEGKALILVDDTQNAIKSLAKWYREQFSMPFVGVTGSVGKTSTKDMIASVLSEKYVVHKTEGNFNNEIGLPLTVFNINDTHEVVVLEMGMSNSGEISRLTKIVQPDVAVITNIGVSHIENLGSRENILKAKMEIVEELKKDGLLIVNSDDDMLSTIIGKTSVNLMSYGIENKGDISATNIVNRGEDGVDFTLQTSQGAVDVSIPVPGIHNVYNALAASLVGMKLGLSLEEIVKGISKYSSGKMRMNIIKYGNYKIINDAYNASPQSMEAAIKVLMDVSNKKRTIAVLGDMLELGDFAINAHIGVGEFTAKTGVDYLIACGTNAQYIADGAKNSGMEPENVFCFTTNVEAAKLLKDLLVDDTTVLIKGSRGMKMEEIINFLDN